VTKDLLTVEFMLMAIQTRSQPHERGVRWCGGNASEQSVRNATIKN